MTQLEVPSLEDSSAGAPTKSATPNGAWERLVGVVQALSLAKNLPDIMSIVRKAARQLSSADGATFILRQDDYCFYADEDAIAPLWKGKRFPVSSCLSGWVMMNSQPLVIEDIYKDPRVPADVYRSTFVKSLVIVPIRTKAPIGAIGVYSARRRKPKPLELALLGALADSTSLAVENAQLYDGLEQRVRDRTVELEAANEELEAFCYSVSHDLRTPVSAIKGYVELLSDDYRPLMHPQVLDFVQKIDSAAARMESLIESMLSLATLSRSLIERLPTDLAVLARDIVLQLRRTQPNRKVEVTIEGNLPAVGDPPLLRIVLDNLFSNAWKYTARRDAPRIEFGRTSDPSPTFFLRDNGAGFDMALARRLFAPFERLHAQAEFPGIGVGLATVQRIIHRHGGRIWAHSKPGCGAIFYFTLDGENEPADPPADAPTLDETALPV